MMYIGSSILEVGPINGGTIQAKVHLAPSAGAQCATITLPLDGDRIVSIDETIEININGKKTPFQVNGVKRELMTGGPGYRVTIEASRPLRQEAS